MGKSHKKRYFWVGSSGALLCPKRRPYEHVRRCPYGAPECLSQLAPYGHTIRRTPFHVMRLVHTKDSNVLVTYFYVHKNTYRNIRILKLYLFLPYCFYVRLPLQVIQMGIAQSVPLSHIKMNHYFTVSTQRPVSHAIITQPTTLNTDRTTYSALLVAKTVCNTYQNPASPTPLRRRTAAKSKGE